LKNDPELRFHFLTDLCGIHYPDSYVEEQFAVVITCTIGMKINELKLKRFLTVKSQKSKQQIFS
jgi:NADH-quinone oxidoreductase subunit C